MEKQNKDSLLKAKKKVLAFIPAILTVSYYFINRYYKVSVMDSDNFTCLLTAIISGVSIIIGLFGVLLTNLISIRRDSELVQYFFESVDKKYFDKSVRKCILSGFVNLFFSALLILNDVLFPKVGDVLLFFWIYTIVLFSIRSYRFISILISLIISDEKRYSGKKNNQTVTGDREKELISKIKKV